MNRNNLNLDDEMSANPGDLLRQFRQICEVIGAAKVRHTPVSPDLLDQLTRIEAELQTRLWLAKASADAAGKPAKPRQKPVDTGCSDSANARQSKAPSADGCADVYCDGACLGNPGPGGYAALVRFAGRPDHQLSGGKPRTTNNEMELSGAIAGLRAAISLGASTIKVQSDSEYLIKGITKWVAGWQRNGWKTSTGGAVKNRALWEELSQLCAGRSVTWSWIRGHSGHTENERCDDLAVSAAKQYAPRRTF